MTGTEVGWSAFRLRYGAKPSGRGWPAFAHRVVAMGVLMALYLLICPRSAQAASLLPFAQGQASSSRQGQMPALGYVEEEWRLHGRASSYAADNKWQDDGLWSVKADKAPHDYETRILIRRPRDPSRFNGTVLVEWMNTGLGFDLDGAWMLTRDEIVREGYIWVGVSAEAASVSMLKGMNPVRYATSQVQADNGQAYDIYTQAATLLRPMAAQWAAQAKGSPKPHMLALGYSQSGSYLITYINAFQPITHAFDGFYLASTAAVGMPLTTSGSRYFNPQYRAEPSAPVMQVSTEMEVMVGWQLSKTPDTQALRHWEIPGAVHLDKYLQQEVVNADLNGQRMNLPDCIKPTNTLPTRVFNKAALHALHDWVTQGKAPPVAPRMQRNSWGFVRYDDVGNAMGGLRMPDLDVPVAEYGMYSNIPRRGWSTTSFYACMAGGSRNPLDAEKLRARYPSEKVYFEAYKRAADQLLAKGFLLAPDHAVLLEQAKAVKLPH